MTSIDSSEVSNTAQVSKIPRFYDLGGTGSPVLNVNRTYFFDGNPAHDDVASLHIRRDVSYKDGTPYFLNSTLLIESNISTTTGAFECGLFVIQNNQSSDGQNFAMGAQANKLGDGSAWALVTETHERNSSSDPTTGTLGYELDIHANGTDANLQRIGIAILAKKEDEKKPEMTLGVGISIEDGEGAGNRISRGIMFGRNSTTDFDYCIDTTHASFSTGGAAILLGHDQAISFTDDGTRRLRYIESSKRLRYEGLNGHTFDFNDDGNLSITSNYQVFGEQVITSRRKGWGNTSGPVSRNGFDTTNVSLPELAQVVAALIQDLKIHGLIGA